MTAYFVVVLYRVLWLVITFNTQSDLLEKLREVTNVVLGQKWILVNV